MFISEKDTGYKLAMVTKPIGATGNFIVTDLNANPRHNVSDNEVIFLDDQVRRQGAFRCSALVAGGVVALGAMHIGYVPKANAADQNAFVSKRFVQVL